MTERIEQAHWETFLNDFAKKHHGFEARMEILGRDFGDQEAAAWLPFTGVSYDPHHHQIFVTVGGLSSHYPVHLTHAIDAPQTVAVRYTPAGEVSSLLRGCLETKPLQQKALGHMRSRARNGLTG